MNGCMGDSSQEAETQEIEFHVRFDRLPTSPFPRS